jgi:uncharacterized protein
LSAGKAAPDGLFSAVKIAVSNIPEEGMPIKFSKDENWFGNYLPATQETSCRLEKVEVACFVKRIGETVYLEGQLDTAVSLECSRCLEETCLPVACRFNYIFSPSGGPHQDEQELSADDMDFIYYEDESIDLEPIVYEQIVMQIPIKALCRDSCQGLCPHCGINLNQEQCRCRERQVDERFAILKKLKV